MKLKLSVSMPSFCRVITPERVIYDGAADRVIARIAWSAWFPALSPRLDTLLFAARNADGIILDLRGNPGGVIGMIAGISGHFLDSAVSLGALTTRSGVLRFAANPRRVDPAGNRVAPFAGPVAVLVDDFTASTSEFFTSGMQALGRARVFGVRSAGQALPAAMGRLPSGDVLMHVIADHADPRTLRLSFVTASEEQIRIGIQALADAIRESCP